MEQIKISISEVENTAANLRIVNQQIYDILQNASNEMNRLHSFWISESSETARQQFMRFAAQFDIQREIIQSYAQFLEHTAQTYLTLESTINSNASTF